jgi:hypothetical protein
MCANATAKKRKRKIAAMCKHGSEQSSTENTSHLADKKPFEKDQNGGDIHERTDRRITSTETVFLAKELKQQRDPAKVGNFPVSTRLLQKSTGEEEEAANLEKQ